MDYIISTIGNLLVVIFALSMVDRIWRWYRLSHIPGPFWAGFSRTWMARHALNRRLPEAAKTVSDRYGPLARIGPNQLVTSDPDIFRRTTAVRSPYVRSPSYRGTRFDPRRDHIISQCDEAEHARIRSMMAAGYSGKENKDMETTIDFQIANLVRLLETKYISTHQDYKPVDISQKILYFTLDLVSHLGFGHPFGYLDQDCDPYDYIKITRSCLTQNSLKITYPWIATVLHSPLFFRLFPNETDKQGFGAFIGVARKLVAERFRPDSVPRHDMLGSFIRRGLTQDEAATEALLQILAGSDTSATTVRIVLLNLVGNPVAYRRLVDEIDQGVASKTISSPIRDVEARRMPYLQAVIKEGLRIKPPVASLAFKRVPPGGDVIDGKFIPGGTDIGSSVLAIEQSVKIFGLDAELFRPERWLEPDEKRLTEMTSTVDLVFHHGKYQCLGKPVALMELNKIFVELLRRFDFALVHPEQPAKIQNIGLWLFDGLWVRVTRRI